jgi:Putative zinc-finger
MSDHVLDRLSAFLDEELPAREHEVVEGHLRACSACAARLDLLRAVDGEARALTITAPAGYFEALPGRIRGRLERSTRRRTLRPPVWSLAVAAALLLAVVTPLTMRRNGVVPPPMAAPVVTYPSAAAAEAEADKAVVPAAPPAAGKDLGAKEEVPSAELRLDAKLRDQAPQRRDRPEAGASLAQAPPAGAAPTAAPAPADERKLQETVTADAESPSMAVAPPRARKAGPGGPYAQQQAPRESQSTPAFAEAPVEAPSAGAAEESRPAASNEAARDEGLAKRDSQGAREKAAVGGAAAGRVSSAVSSSDEKVFRVLQDAAMPTTLAALRERREAWRSFTRDFPASPRADEARVRVVETGAAAWRAGGDAADLVRAREDASAYLARRDAPQAVRVRALLDELPAKP